MPTCGARWNIRPETFCYRLQTTPATPPCMFIQSNITARCRDEKMLIPQMEPWLGEEEATAVHDYLRSGGWLTEHDKTRKFESIIAAYTGASHCIVTVNGTISLTLAALACDVRAGDEVIVPNYTMI